MNHSWCAQHTLPDYYALAAAGVVGTTGTATVLGNSLMAVNVLSAGASLSSFSLNASGQNGLNLASDVTSLGIDIFGGKLKGAYKAAIFGADALFNFAQGTVSANAAYNDFGERNYAGAAVNVALAGLGFSSGVLRGTRIGYTAPKSVQHVSPITGRPINLNGRIRQVKPANGPTRFTPLKENGSQVAAGMDHVRRRHFSGSNTQSQFSVTPTELKRILQSGVVRQAPLRQSGTGRQAMWARDVNVGQIVGRTRIANGANSTSTIRVFVDEAGNLITTFPIPGT